MTFSSVPSCATISAMDGSLKIQPFSMFLIQLVDWFNLLTENLEKMDRFVFTVNKKDFIKWQNIFGSVE